MDMYRYDLTGKCAERDFKQLLILKKILLIHTVQLAIHQNTRVKESLKTYQ